MSTEQEVMSNANKYSDEMAIVAADTLKNLPREKIPGVEYMPRGFERSKAMWVNNVLDATRGMTEIQIYDVVNTRISIERGGVFFTHYLSIFGMTVDVYDSNHAQYTSLQNKYNMMKAMMIMIYKKQLELEKDVKYMRANLHRLNQKVSDHAKHLSKNDKEIEDLKKEVSDLKAAAKNSQKKTSQKKPAQKK